MSKNILREYEDGFFDDDRYSKFDRLQKESQKRLGLTFEKEQEKKQTLQRKRIRRLKESY